METLLAAGTGIGLSSIAGVRAYLPLALVGLFARFGLFELSGPFDLLSSWIVIGVLLVLALVETGLDKVPALGRVVDVVQTPVRIVAGGVLFAAAFQAGVSSDGFADLVPEAIIGGGIAAVVAVLKVLLRPSADAASAGVSASFLSTFEDVVAGVGGVVALLVPLVPLLFVAFLLFFFYRVRKRRGRKFGGLRILGD
ncbi:MAG: hypothetical protein AVDCRST_MAG37-10 [uncultured Rubrobacteraceae bacterium]|uniref:DUF4126 domain-containing protein n=1 Tax=uncultured Rubrobacteraceae bacterium TaxID=349277 RepID=A0A6J4PS60_9ACTN|nr:MAG: hypothetical protein AVDCRST_MAG37-10 [uncultured Rubrobacteraceae bacterium]